MSRISFASSSEGVADQKAGLCLSAAQVGSAAGVYFLKAHLSCGFWSLERDLGLFSPVSFLIACFLLLFATAGDRHDHIMMSGYMDIQF